MNHLYRPCFPIIYQSSTKKRIDDVNIFIISRRKKNEQINLIQEHREFKTQIQRYITYC
jgi:hypothetical protein